MQCLSPTGLRVRVAGTALISALLILGTLFGQDDAFPFGPFRMYSTTDQLNAPVRDTRVEATDTTGRIFLLTERNTGFRRAEVEGQLTRFQQEPALLQHLAAAHARRNPGAPAITHISIVIRWHELANGRPTGANHEETIVTWNS